MYRPAFVLRRHVPHQALARRALVLVICCDVTEGLAAELAFGPIG